MNIEEARSALLAAGVTGHFAVRLQNGVYSTGSVYSKHSVYMADLPSMPECRHGWTKDFETIDDAVGEALRLWLSQPVVPDEATFYKNAAKEALHGRPGRGIEGILDDIDRSLGNAVRIVDDVIDRVRDEDLHPASSSGLKLDVAAVSELSARMEEMGADFEEDDYDDPTTPADWNDDGWENKVRRSPEVW